MMSLAKAPAPSDRMERKYGMTGTTIASSMLIAGLAFEPVEEDSSPILCVAEMERLEPPNPSHPRHTPGRGA